MGQNSPSQSSPVKRRGCRPQVPAWCDHHELFNLLNHLHTVGLDFFQTLSAECVFEAEVDERGRSFGFDSSLQVKLIRLQGIIYILLSPVYNGPVKMIFKHGNHCVLNILLILRELSRHLLVELFGKSLDDHVGIGNPISIYLHKGSIPFLDRNSLL